MPTASTRRSPARLLVQPETRGPPTLVVAERERGSDATARLDLSSEFLHPHPGLCSPAAHSRMRT
jgi:hypothetical protein